LLLIASLYLFLLRVIDCYLFFFIADY